MLIDSHCHLDRLDLSAYEGELSGALNAARDSGVTKFLCVSIDMSNVDEVIKIAQAHEDVYASVGVHPLNANTRMPTTEELVSLANHKKVIAVGETGLDYYYSEETIELQQQSFIQHLNVSQQTRLPTIVHTRDAKEDTLALLKQYSDSRVGGVLHCFTEDMDMALKAIEMNFYISFSGIVTFKNATELKNVAKQLPLDRILVETDSPYLAPLPYRGKSNEPKYVANVAKYIAELRDISYEKLIEQTSINFNNLFNLS